MARQPIELHSDAINDAREARAWSEEPSQAAAEALMTPEAERTVVSFSDTGFRLGHRALSTVFFLLVVGLGSVFSLPNSAAVPVLFFWSATIPAVLTVGVVYGKGDMRVFCIGALFPAVALLFDTALILAISLLSSPFSRKSLGPNSLAEWSEFCDAIGSQCRVCAVAWWVLGGLVGLTCVVARRAMMPQAAEDSASSVDARRVSHVEKTRTRKQFNLRGLVLAVTVCAAVAAIHGRLGGTSALLILTTVIVMALGGLFLRDVVRGRRSGWVNDALIGTAAVVYGTCLLVSLVGVISGLVCFFVLALSLFATGFWPRRPKRAIAKTATHSQG